MRKKLVSLLLCMTTSAMLLAGCGASAGTAGTADKAADTATSGGDETGASTAAADSKAAQAVAERKAEAEKSGEYQKVVISFFDWTGRPAGLDRINANSIIGKIYITTVGVVNDITVDLVALPPNTDLTEIKAG